MGRAGALGVTSIRCVCELPRRTRLRGRLVAGSTAGGSRLLTRRDAGYSMRHALRVSIAQVSKAKCSGKVLDSGEFGRVWADSPRWHPGRGGASCIGSRGPLALSPPVVPDLTGGAKLKALKVYVTNKQCTKKGREPLRWGETQRLTLAPLPGFAWVPLPAGATTRARFDVSGARGGTLARP